jgi:hypothetical protein
MAITGLASVISSSDGSVQSWVQSSRSEGGDQIARIAEPFGNGRYVFPSLGLAYCYGRISGDERIQRASLLSIESALVSGAVSGAVKYLSHKHRPPVSSPDEDEAQWDGPGFHNADLSFPSGHSTLAFALATVMVSEYSDHRIVAPIAYGIASLVAFSRVSSNSHWVSDVIVGASIGHFTARAIEDIHGGNGDGHLSLAPVLDRRGPGLCMAVKF